MPSWIIIFTTGIADLSFSPLSCRSILHYCIPLLSSPVN